MNTALYLIFKIDWFSKFFVIHSTSTKIGNMFIDLISSVGNGAKKFKMICYEPVGNDESLFY